MFIHYRQYALWVEPQHSSHQQILLSVPSIEHLVTPRADASVYQWLYVCFDSKALYFLLVERRFVLVAGGLLCQDVFSPHRLSLPSSVNLKFFHYGKGAVPQFLLFWVMVRFHR